MNKEKIKQKLEEILFNQNIDNPYININVAVDWIADNFTPKAKPKVAWIEEWTELFPKDVMSNGQPIYSTPKDCVNKMQKFLKDNPEYEKELIFAATKVYLLKQRQKDWEFTRTASNFINHQQKGSLLASWCEACLGNRKPTEVEEIKPFFI
jgi:hypothetical protein